MDYSLDFPRQNLPFKSKGIKWRKQCVDCFAHYGYFNHADIRTSVVSMKINYDLVNGKIHMSDVSALLDQGDTATTFVPDKIQHYPIINSKLNTLRGEEAARVFDWRVIVTNPYSISKIEEDKKNEFFANIQEIVENPDIDGSGAERQMSDTVDYYDHDWQDLREIRANELLRHYAKAQNFKQIFNNGFFDACTVAREIYQCGIVGGEPVLVRMNPMKLRIYQNGSSNKIEDADVLVYEDYWSKGKIYEAYYDELTAADRKKLDEIYPNGTVSDVLGAAGNINEAFPFVRGGNLTGEDGILVENNGIDLAYDELGWLDGGIGSDLMPYDVAGNIRVTRVWWKSDRKIYRVKSYDPVTGEEVYDFYPETYIPDKNSGEEAKEFWVKQAWEGTKIGEDIYVGIRPCPVQYNTLDNPSRCHFGIIGTVYNINESVPYSLVDMMKPYNYLYDAVHAKLVDLIATNWGRLLEMDLAQKPKNWKVEQWMYFARKNKVLIKDSFREGSKGASTGKLAGALNNATKGYVDADWGDTIQSYIQILQWAKDAMSDLVGINRQREGNTYNRETVGGIERAVLQSSYITDWLFLEHDDTKRRVLEAFLEQAKVALRGRSKTFQYTLSDKSLKIMTVEGDVFAESSYGVLVDNDSDTQKMASQIESIAQAAAQNNSMDSATILRLFTSLSLQEKLKLVEKSEKRMQQMQQEAAERQQQLEMQKLQVEQMMKEREIQQKDVLNQRDNDTRIRVAEINSQAEYLRLGIYEDQNNEEIREADRQVDIDRLQEDIRQFDKELRFKEDELKSKERIEMKKIEAAKQARKTN